MYSVKNNTKKIVSLKNDFDEAAKSINFTIWLYLDPWVYLYCFVYEIENTHKAILWHANIQSSLQEKQLCDWVLNWNCNFFHRIPEQLTDKPGLFRPKYLTNSYVERNKPAVHFKENNYGNTVLQR